MPDLYWVPGQKNDDRYEYWYPVSGFEGYYEVSTWGNVRRIVGGRGSRVKDGVPYLLSCRPNSRGYKIVNLYKNNCRITVKVHKLVIDTFDGKVPYSIRNQYEVGHKDGNKLNNHLSNLEYTSSYENLMEQQRRYYKTGSAF